ncbi:MAG: TetR/AcrR family transcriptional regulator [Polyangiaceae bacterium]|jgi:AcrR family transcriptional regulator
MNDRSARTERTKPLPRASLPPNLKADGNRRRVLEAALRLFAAQGFHGSSMRELAAVAELQPSALYVHFPSKEHLLAELVRAGHEAHHDALRAALLEAGNDPVAQVTALVRVHVQMHATYPELAIVVNSEMAALSKEMAAPGMALRRQAASLLRDVIVRGTAMGRFSPPDTEAATAAIAAMGLRVPYWYSPDTGKSVERLAEVHVELALRMLGAVRT